MGECQMRSPVVRMGCFDHFRDPPPTRFGDRSRAGDPVLYARDRLVEAKALVAFLIARPRPARSPLSDILFDEIDELRGGDGDPTKSLAVANLAKQIINTAKVELDFHRVIAASEATYTFRQCWHAPDL